ncbi:MAG: RDD family protein [Actinobacteria bacterium]|nr:RDD family protein [Actinomycetota bacterium]
MSIEGEGEDGSAPRLPQATYGRRLLALCIDWFASYIIARLVTQQLLVPGWIQLSIFFLEVSFFTILIGGSAGQVLLGIRIVDIDTGMRIGFLPSIMRTFLICLVVPPLLTVHGRGLHDRAVRSVAILNI